MRNHLLRYEFLTYIRNRDSIVWLVAFPLAFVTFFCLALSSLLNEDAIELPTLRVAIIEEVQTEEVLSFLEEAGGQEATFVDDELKATKELEEDPLVLYTEMNSHEEAKQFLLDKKIDAIFLPKEELEFEMTYQVGYLPTLVDGLAKAYSTINNVAGSIESGLQNGDIPMESFDPEAMAQLSQNASDFTEEGRVEGINSMQIFIFSVLGYLAFFPVSSGLDVVDSVQADLSKQSMRKSVSPVPKKRHFLASFLARSSVHLVLVSFTYAYVLFLGMKPGDQHLANLVLIWLGTLASIVTGCVIGSIFKGNGIKSAFAIGLPLLFGAASGMMSEVVHEAVMVNVPWLHNYNPLGRVTNGLYASAVEGIGSRYYDQLIGLALYIVIGLIITSLLVKEDQYESL